MYLILLVVHAVLSLTLVTLIFMQHGKGAEAGVAFGVSTGSHQHNMGMTRFIGVLSLIFFVTSLALGFLSSHNQEVGSQLNPWDLSGAPQA